MKATQFIATLAASFLLFATAPTASAQRGAKSQEPRNGQVTRTANRPSNRPQASAPKPGNHNPATSRPVPHANPAPQHHHAPAPAPAPQHHHHAPAPAPQHHHHAPAPAPQHHHHAPAPRTFAPRHYGPKPVYHQHIDSRARVFYIDQVPYYSYGGVYYQYIPNYGYQEIYMPENVIVTNLPYGANRVYVNNIGYYQADGMWFQPIDGGYLLVQQPVATVTVAVPRPTISFHASFGF